MNSLDKLYGQSILIGRDTEGQGQLCVLMAVNGKYKMAKLGQVSTVPNSVSRCVPAERKAHLRLDISPEGKLSVTNLKMSNVTFVNGIQIMSKNISEKDRLELGQEHFYLDMDSVIHAASEMIGGEGGGVLRFSIRHLEGVWTKYKEEDKKIAEHVKSLGMLARVPMIFTMCAGVISGIAGPLGWGNSVKYVGIAGTILGLCLVVYSLYKTKTDKSTERREKNLEWLQENYICPNPACRKFVGATRYKMLKTNTGMRCPHCKCIWVE